MRLTADGDDPPVVALAPERLDRASPASDVPTTATVRIRESYSEMEIAWVGQSRNGLLDQRTRRFRRLLLEYVEEVVVTHFEDLGSDSHAHRVARALVVVDDDLHPRTPNCR